MKPLSRTKRHIFLILFTIVFVLSLPLIILYARGYRLTEALQFGQTGGFFISATQSGAEVYINEKLAKKTGIFQKNALVQNLKPGSYDIRVVKEGFQVWRKTLTVFPETVTEVYPFLLPESPDFAEIPRYLDSNGIATTTPPGSLSKNQKENPEYVRVRALFTVMSTKITTPKTSTSTDLLKTQRKLSVENRNGKLYVEWFGKVTETPGYFCQNDECKNEIVITVPAKVRTFEFYPGRGDILIVSLADGIYVAEIDDRSEQNIQKLFDGTNLEFRLEGDLIFVKEDIAFYSLAL